LNIEHNYLEHVSQISVPSPQPGEAFLFRYNKVKDLDSRMSNMVPITTGNGGKPGEGHFVQISARGVPIPGVEIAWNEIVNFPDESGSGDHVNIYTAAGTESSPMDVHHNFVMGAYPYPSSYQGKGCIGLKADGGTQAYTGSGMTTDGHGEPITGPNDITQWVDFHNNRLVNCCNGGINLTIGSNTRAHHNRMVHSGIVPNADRTPAYSTTPGGVRNVHQIAPAYFQSNSFDHNEYWWPKAGSQPYGSAAIGVHDNIELAATLGVGATPSDEDAEYGAFLDEAQAARIVIGPTK
jgi:hypothetical protein